MVFIQRNKKSSSVPIDTAGVKYPISKKRDTYAKNIYTSINQSNNKNFKNRLIDMDKKYQIKDLNLIKEA